MVKQMKLEESEKNIKKNSSVSSKFYKMKRYKTSQDIPKNWA